MNKLGIVQGRILTLKYRNVQSFPLRDWENEFEKANKLKIKYIQWLYSNENNKLNPLLNKRNKTKIINLAKTNNIKINSICAHRFIKNKIIKNNSIDYKNLNDLIYLIKIASFYNMSYIVIPFIEESSLLKNKNDKILLKFFNLILPFLKKYKVNLHLESDYSSVNLVKLIKKAKSSYFKICIDTGNICYLGYSIYDEIINSKKYIGCVHIKDRKKNGNSKFLGKGDVDFNKVFKALKKINFSNEVYFESKQFKSKNNFEIVNKYVNYLKKFNL